MPTRLIGPCSVTSKPPGSTRGVIASNGASRAIHNPTNTKTNHNPAALTPPTFHLDLTSPAYGRKAPLRDFPRLSLSYLVV